jgi:hypothetical protein
MLHLQVNALVHQEDDTLLGVTWRDLAALGKFGCIGHLGK